MRLKDTEQVYIKHLVDYSWHKTDKEHQSKLLKSYLKVST